MALTDDEKSDLGRHLEFPIQGLAQTGPAGQGAAVGDAGFRFFGVFGSLLYRMNQFSPIEEAKLTGKAYAAVSFNTPLTPLPGDTVGVTISGGSLVAPITVSVTVPPTNQQSTPWSCQTIAAALQQAFTLNTAFQQSGFYALAPWGAQPWATAKIPNPICAIIAPSGSPPFQIAATFSGSIAPQIAANGALPAPFLPSGSACNAFVLYGYIPIANQLEANMLGTTNHLTARQANNTIINPQELEQREDQYKRWCLTISKYIGLPLNPMVLERGGGSCAVW